MDKKLYNQYKVEFKNKQSITFWATNLNYCGERIYPEDSFSKRIHILNAREIIYIEIISGQIPEDVVLQIERDRLNSY